MEGLENFLREIDDGLVCYKEEFVKLAVKSDSTLKYLRPYEVENMNIPPVYRRMLIDRIVNLQTPGTKEKLKQKCLDEFLQPKTPKRLKFGSQDVPITNVTPTTVSGIGGRRSPTETAPRAPDNFLEQEVNRLNEERDSLSVILVHKKDELNDLKQKPNLPTAISIPGNPITKSSCDNCHRKGHRSIMNRGNKSCPFMKCEGYHFCGQEGKHPDHKHSVTEVTKEINDVERRLKNINDELNSIKMFQKHNNTNFITAMRPILKSLFSMKYEGKDGAQNLQRDLRYIKIATNSQIPEDQSLDHISNLISKGKSRVSSAVDPFVTSENMLKQNTEIKPGSTGCSSPPLSTVSPAPQPLLQSSPYQMAQYNPYFPIASPTSPYQYVMYPNHWNSMYDVYGNGYPMYPTNPTTSSTAPPCAANPPLPLDSPPKNPPLPKDL